LAADIAAADRVAPDDRAADCRATRCEAAIGVTTAGAAAKGSATGPITASICFCIDLRNSRPGAIVTNGCHTADLAGREDDSGVRGSSSATVSTRRIAEA
jgi:hypothetical protein